jgi:Amt family ammonium transporter
LFLLSSTFALTFTSALKSKIDKAFLIFTLDIFIFVVFLSSVIYPIQGHWTWGGSELGGLIAGFSDFAGSTIVHSVGGWAALAAVLVLGARKGKYTKLIRTELTSSKSLD